MKAGDLLLVHAALLVLLIWGEHVEECHRDEVGIAKSGSSALEL